MGKRVLFWANSNFYVKSGNFIFDKLITHGFDVLTFYDYVSGKGSHLIKRRLRFFMNLIKILFISTKNDVIFTHDNFATWKLALVFRVLGMKRNICINNFMYEGGGICKRKLFSYALSKQKIAVNSTDLKKKLLQDIPGLKEERIFVIPDCIEVIEKKMRIVKSDQTLIKESEYIFSGGSTRRDYKLVLDVAKERNDWNFVIVASKNQQYMFSEVPSNVTVFYNIPFDSFVQKLKNSKIVFVPLNSQFQGGQLVLFIAALLKKPMVTSETYTIRTYFDDDSCSFIPIGNKEAAIKRLNDIMNKAPKELDNRCDMAYKQVKKFDVDYCFNLMLKMISQN